MAIYTTLPWHIQEVDVIIAGGGIAGCIVASRLADADPELSILIIESGRDNYNVPTVNHPVLWRGNYVPDDPRVFFHKAVKEEQLADRESIAQVGNTLGGGSSINLMMYTRAQQCDYNSWNTEGWTADDLLPYLKKFETYHGLRGKDHHGYNDPIQVSDGPFCSTKADDDFIAALEEVGYHEVEDLQDFNSVSVARGRKYVFPEGKRQDVANTYLHPRLQDGKHPNLHVLVESQVIRVIFDNNRASGVEFRPNPALQPNPVQGARTVKARKLVVISCGTLGTPPILERSGIGNPDILERASIATPPIADLLGVGHDYQDHNISIYTYKADLPPDMTTDGIHSGQVDISALLESKNKILGWNGIDVWSKLRPTSFRTWDRDFNDPSKPLVTGIFITGLLGNRSRVPPGQYISVGVYTAYPYSWGHVHITGRSMDDRLDFKTGYLSDNFDLDLKGEVSYRHPVFPPESKASYAYDTPKGSATPNMTTCWHGIGTCKMAPREQLGVVDNNLGVYGVRGLKVADLSIIPENVCANTMNTALTIGEKAADIIIQELSLTQQ
ncbi:putative alcohol oxidase [Biscogniauxia marginata]|nr:putative alcohol oxidase [Biscogniauxia marginata]